MKRWLVGVFVSHFAETYLSDNGKTSLTVASWRIGMIASPTFMILSGCLLGVFWATRRDRFGETQLRYLDRGLFLLTIGRVIIAIGHLPHTGLAKILEWGFVTDAIGFSLVAAPFLVPRLSPWARVGAGVLVFAGSWVVIRAWHPLAPGWIALKELVFGPGGEADPHVFVDDFPLLPWFGIYLAATALGETLARARATGGWPSARRVVRTVAIPALSLGVTLPATAILARRVLGWPLSETARNLLSPFRKLPPGPTYALFYGGLGLGFLWLLFWLEASGRGEALLDVLGVLGRNSLFVFVVQYYVFFAAFGLLKPAYSPSWPLLLAGCSAFIWLAARWWERHDLNPLLTVGLAKRSAARRAAS
jgi:uncharacterized membrane protein